MTHHHHHRKNAAQQANAKTEAQTGARYPGNREQDDAAEQGSPAARYQAFRDRQRHAMSAAAAFENTLEFALDDFQRDAIDALEEGRNVLVAAPTGAGKTIVADFAMFLAQRRNVKAFYTTPIKALSNQKYHDLAAVYGQDRVGLLTGDMSVNPDADIVVMTTEVLRNMIYENSTTLDALEYVVLDEVHYLADRFRGQVWEEVIVHLPARVKIVGLSATVSNVEDFSAWIESVRGDTALVISEHRPVPLERHVMTQRDDRTEPQLWDLYRSPDSDQVNPGLVHELARLDREGEKRARAFHDGRDSRDFGDRGGRGGRGKHGRGNGMARSGRDSRDSRGQDMRHFPKRWAVIDELDFLGLLPGIYFIFSRAGCDRAVEQCVNAGLRLTTDEEAARIRQIVDGMMEGQIDRADAKALGFSRFRFALEQGFAPHHAGMIALFRQIVETLFEQGLVKVVFATETLALGINMPARSVIVEKLEKFNGEGHVPLTPGEFTQLTGRAGRRGIDVIGHAVIVDHRGFQPQLAAALSSKRVYPLHSSFSPTFNMAVNLLNSSSYAEARTTLDHSFAQWEANESAEDLEGRIDALEQALEGYEKAFSCDRGDFREFMRLRMALTDAERKDRRRASGMPYASPEERRQALKAIDDRIADLRRQERAHPCRSCPDLAEHLRWGNRWAKQVRELERLRDRYESRTGSVARRFERICEILRILGYVGGDDTKDYHVTQKGQLLRHLYGELDIVLAESLSQGLLDDLSVEELVAVVSGFVFESRRDSSGEPRHYPGGAKGRIHAAAVRIAQVHDSITSLCEDWGLDDLQPLDFGACDIMFDWSSGKSLATVLDGTDMTGGDFVRSCKRVADALGQIAAAAPWLANRTVADRAHDAALTVNRGVVAYSGIE
ncbi:MAG: DEAD/DEAH box helicase [Bifidobacteriaceae bacterium]|nr:DEAD/DEAH box helicase [Bifidobacteriaceae bacterium]